MYQNKRKMCSSFSWSSNLRTNKKPLLPGYSLVISPFCGNRSPNPLRCFHCLYYLAFSRADRIHTPSQLLKPSYFLHGFKNIILLLVFLPLWSLILCLTPGLLLSTTWHLMAAFSTGLCESLVPSCQLPLLDHSSIPHGFSHICMPMTTISVL